MRFWETGIGNMRGDVGDMASKLRRKEKRPIVRAGSPAGGEESYVLDPYRARADYRNGGVHGLAYFAALKLHRWSLTER